MRSALLCYTLFLFTTLQCVGQDSTDTNEPYIVTSKFYKIEYKPHNFYVYSGISFSINRDYYDVCPDGDCQQYLNSVRSVTKNYFNNSLALGFVYAPKKFYSEIGFSYSRYRDVFNATDPAGNSVHSINRYDYADLSLMAGYKIRKWWRKPSLKHQKWRSNVRYLLLGGLVMSKKMEVDGKTLSRYRTGQIVPLQQQVQFYDYTVRAEVGARIMYQLSTTMYMMCGVFYSYDLRSIVQSSELYIRQRNIIGLNISLMYNL